MSPLPVRRCRAERLLRQEFEVLRGRVIDTARGRLLASGVLVDQSDLEGCYGQAWQGLYAAVLDGHRIVNPAGWLVLVTVRRALDEHRARRREVHAGHVLENGPGAQSRAACSQERDLAAELDDRIRLRELFEGLSARLSARELQAATLCYLHGLTRAEAAERMGLSEARMRKLMEGAGSGRPGVATKVGALVETIRVGGWCAEQASLMRGYAYGILDPHGDRYRLASLHRDECPACRAYVISLRGLAAALPPVFPPSPLAAAVLAGAGTQAGSAAGGALGAASAAGGGAAGSGGTAGGGWMLAGGSLGAKLAAGLLALGVGVGCVALNPAPDHGRSPAGRRGPARAPRLDASALAGAAMASRPRSLRSRRGVAAPAPRARTLKPPRPTTGLREFGPERERAAGTPVPIASARRPGAAGQSSATVAAREFGPG